MGKASRTKGNSGELEVRRLFPHVEKPSLIERLAVGFTFDPDGCWRWVRGRTSAGYGMVHVKGKHRLAHRVMYELLVGPIPRGLQIDHLCRVRHCVNPEHMEVVTNRENTLRGLRGRLRGQG